MHRRQLLATGAAATVASLLARIARAAPIELAPDVDGKFEDMSINPIDEKYIVPDKRERDAFLANVRAFETIMRNHKAWAKPRGFDVVPHLAWGAGRDHEAPPAPISAMLMFFVIWYLRDDHGKVFREDEAPLHLFVTFNQPDSVFESQYHQVARDAAGQMYREPATVPTQAGVPRYETGHVLTKRTQPLWLPVSRKRLVEAWLAEARKEKRQPEISRLEQLLAAMSADEAASQAYWTGWRALGKPGDPGAQPVSSVNLQFFDPKLPRSAIQIAIVGNPYGADTPYVRSVQQALGHQGWPKLLATLA